MRTLLKKIERFMAAHGFSDSGFGFNAMNDRSFVAELRKGKRRLRRATIKKVSDFIKNYRPPNPKGTRNAKGRAQGR